MTPHFILCAERAARTTEGTFVLHGIIERVFVKQEPTAESPLTIPAMSVAFDIRDAKLTQQRSVQVQLAHKETGTVLFSQGFGVEATNDPADKISGILNFHLIQIKALGEYEVTVSVDGTQVGTNSFFVVMAPAAQAK